MKKIGNLAREFEEKAPPKVLKICLVSFLASFLIGFCLGLVFRELRLNFLTASQKAQKIEEEKRLERLFQEFSQVRFFQQK